MIGGRRKLLKHPASLGFDHLGDARAIERARKPRRLQNFIDRGSNRLHRQHHTRYYLVINVASELLARCREGQAHVVPTHLDASEVLNVDIRNRVGVDEILLLVGHRSFVSPVPFPLGYRWSHNLRILSVCNALYGYRNRCARGRKSWKNSLLLSDAASAPFELFQLLYTLLHERFAQLVRLFFPAVDSTDGRRLLVIFGSS